VIVLTAALGVSAADELTPAPIASDATVRYDYDVVYVRAPRAKKVLWANTEPPTINPPAAELMLLRPDSTQEVLVGVEPHESIGDPFVSYDGKAVYFAKYHRVTPLRGQDMEAGSDIYRVDVATRKVTRLTHQERTPNRGAFDAQKHKLPAAVYNLGPCPLPGGRVVFTSDRNQYRGVQDLDTALQLFVMDDDGRNVEEIGQLNLGGAMHPVVLKDGRVMFSSAETQGIRTAEQWGIWVINPDGTNWDPLFSGFVGASTSIHFQAQLGGGDIVAEWYYPGATTQGFGTLLRFPLNAGNEYAGFGPGYTEDPRNLHRARTNDVKQRYVKFPFSPRGLSILTEFCTNDDVAPNDHSSDRGKVTHPSAAPDQHMLLVWSPPVAKGKRGSSHEFDSGIYLVKSGGPVRDPGEMLLVKNDEAYFEMWPRALVPYQRLYGVKEPKRLAPLANDGSLSKHLPAGSPFGLVGTSSLYKRESYPQGVVHKGSVTATSHKPGDVVRTYLEQGGIYKSDGTNNWNKQGADAGLYTNDDIWGIRVLALEPVTHKGQFHPQYGHASGGAVSHGAAERMRILGEFPVRKFDGAHQPVDPDGNPDTSFLAKIPANVAWTLQTLDHRGMVLNMAQTWHQVRPGEVRTNCGGCHAHSQQPTAFEQTAAANDSFTPFDLTIGKTPLFTTKRSDESKRKWDVTEKTGVRFAAGGVVNVEYHRDIKPILQRSCVACHSGKSSEPAGNLVLDDETPVKINFARAPVPGTYARLAADESARFGTPPIGGEWHNHSQASRYIRKMQSRRSLLVWKIFGERLDGFSNDDLPTETKAGDASTLAWHGKPLEASRKNIAIADIDFTGAVMPPPEAVAGTYRAADGTKIKVAPLSDEDRLTIVRWIDLGCPVDLDFDPNRPGDTRYGWLHDDQRPTLTVAEPKAGANQGLNRILIGMHDAGTGLDMQTFTVTADVPINGRPAGDNLAVAFGSTGHGVYELKLSAPFQQGQQTTLTVSIKDGQGNESRIVRTFSVLK